MIIKKISVRNFRNIGKTELEFGPATTVFHGKNAEGKTNLLEAMYLPVTGRAFRTKHDASLIKYGEDFCDVTSEWEINGRKNSVSVRYLKENGVPEDPVLIFPQQGKRYHHEGCSYVQASFEEFEKERQKAEMEEFAFANGVDYEMVNGIMTDYIFTGSITEEAIRKRLEPYALGLLKVTMLTQKIQEFVKHTYLKFKAEDN